MIGQRADSVASSGGREAEGPLWVAAAPRVASVGRPAAESEEES